MTIPELIRRKRDGGALADEDIRRFLQGYSAGEIPDYQAAALLMAIFLRGLDARELATWTDAMLRSGAVMDLSDVPRPKIDKHSTGGVGDKISICLAPAVAACGVAVPMVSGRGLGHTGGTLDKLEAIPGFRTALGSAEFRRVLDRCGMVLAGQSDDLAPADRKLYALRDVTGTVESVPLIASSIMSKKLAEGIDGLVLDVKVGKGAFMKTLEDARVLARTLVGIGAAAGKRTSALLTAMDEPIGNAVGNALETQEAINVLLGEGPPDTTELTHALGAEMLLLAGVAKDEADGRARIGRAIASGEALRVLRACIELQGGDPRVCEDQTLLHATVTAIEVRAPRSGYVTAIDAYAIGMAAVRAGAGRLKKEDPVDPHVGVALGAKVGAKVKQGTPLAVVFLRRRDEALVRSVTEAFTVGDEPPAATPLVLEVVRG